MPQDLYYTSPLSAPYGVQEPEEFSRVPKDHYLVMGDNSAHSRDGRYFGWLPRENIVGRVACIWWPPPRWSDFTGFSQTMWWRILVVALISLLFARTFLGRSCAVQISDRTHDAEHLAVSFLHYGFHLPFTGISLVSWRAPARGDLVLYSVQDKEKSLSSLLVGRIVGLPGERVSFSDGAFLANDAPIPMNFTMPEEYASMMKEAPYGRGKTKEHSLVPEGHYFIVSDGSFKEELPYDSRSLGWIARKQIMGRAFFCWWPLKYFGKR